MSEKIVLGIDTSNYTTSVAVMTARGELLANIRRLLTVKEGERGLRQSDAVFAHVKNIPELMTEAEKYINGGELCAVGVSERPRNTEGSYMPCFLSGVATAQSVASACGIPLYRFSHQCGHIMAALYSCSAPSLIDRELAAFHISGGTTELLRVRAAEYGFDAELVGKTLDLNAGQVIDRVGVRLGLGFPAGGALEELAFANNSKIPKKKPSAKGLDISLSGLENLADGLYRDTGDKALVAAFVFDYIGNSICAMSDAYIEKYGNTPILYAGGVMRNSIIRAKLASRYDAYFAEPDMSSDNAVGIAALTVRALSKK